MTDPLTIARALDSAAARLARAGIENPRLEARILVGHVLGVAPPAALLAPERKLGADEWAAFRAALDARCERRPIAQITGRREFWSLDFAVTEATLVPRPDSETVVEAALEALPDTAAPARVLDLGTGTGCLLLAVLSERPAATGLGIDIDPKAVKVAECNARRLGLAGRAAFAVGEWGGGLDQRYELILSNPPYIPTPEIETLEPEVAAFEPRRALDGGADGLDAYRAMAVDLARLLAPGGRAVLEIGAGQAESVATTMAKQMLEIEAIRRDLSGLERCLVLRRGG